MATSNIVTAINAICDKTITVGGVAIKGIRPANMSPQMHITPCHFIPLSGVQVNIQRISMGGRTRYQYTLRHLMLYKSVAQNKLDDTFPQLLAYIAALSDALESVTLPDSMEIQSINQAETGVITYPIDGEVSFASVEVPIVIIESV
jgi:hypothetical protein